MFPHHTKDLIEAGCDEAGRGCLAGPVFGAAVILPKNFKEPILNDSKQLTETERIALRPIIEKKALAWAVVALSAQEIDRINILQASIQTMHQSISLLQTKAEFILVDGNRFKPYWMTPHLCVVKGDSKYASIAAASVLAKTYRDEYMLRMAELFPHYGWHTNKGYPTVKHKAAIKKHGVTPHHRMTFKMT